MTPTASQAAAIDKILSCVAADQKIIKLSGAAGTGKTTIIACLMSELADVVLCTPTNKAAQVLITKGMDAATLYKRFYILEEGNRARGVKPRFISCRRTCEAWAELKGGDWSQYEYKLPDGKRAFADTIIVDEASMLTTRSVVELSKMCNTLILVGDHHQLPPVGDNENPAGYFANLKADAELTEVLRQTEGSLILTLANEIRIGSPRVDRMLKDFQPQDDFADWIKREARIIAFTNKERQRANAAARRILGYTSPLPQLGDRVMVMNNYSDDFINGTEAIVLDFDWDGVSQTAMVSLDNGLGAVLHTSMLMAPLVDDLVSSQKELILDNWEPKPLEEEFLELTYGYCLTGHKAQGSEYPSVAVLNQRDLIYKIQKNNPRAGMSAEDYVRRWTYTVATRARKELAFAPTWWAQSASLGDEE